MNYQIYHDRRKLILSEIVNCDDGTREVLLGELRSLRDKYECDCHHCNEPLLYEHSPQTKQVSGRSFSAHSVNTLSVNPDKTGDTHSLEDLK